MMKRGLVSILFVSLLLVVNSTAISENAQISGKDSNKRYFVEEGREISSINKFGYSVKESKSLKGKIIYVPDDYSTIQKAVDHAQPGDTIIVRDGTYVENVVINKPHLTIKSENGPENCIVRASSRYDPVFSIHDDHITLMGFTAVDGWDGIEVCNSSNSIITDNIISNCKWGIVLGDSTNNIVTKNSVSSNGDAGIELWHSSSNVIKDNIISGKNDGIWIWRSSKNTITKNNISSRDDGIWSWHSSSNTIIKNNISNNDKGIRLSYSFGNRIIRNNFIGNFIQATFENSRSNWWFNNYWDDWKFSLPRPIRGTIYLKFIDENVPWINFDWHPSTELLEG